MVFNNIISSLKNVLFPITCIECKIEGLWMCEECFKKIIFEQNNFCPKCKLKTTQGEVCESCRHDSSLDRIIALFSYEEIGSIAKLIKQFKYSSAYEITALWESIILFFFKKNTLHFNSSVIIPVPLHKRRERERGFNQSFLIAEILFKNFNYIFPSLDAKNLIRFRYTKQQAKLTGEERRKNLLGVFEWKSNTSAPERVFLVDDVFTTGSTMQECAKILKENGTKEVCGFVLARG